MKIKLLLALTIVLLFSTGVSHAGWGWGGGGYCGPRFGWGGGYGWGGGWGGPAFGVTFAAPVPVYRPVYYTQPAPYYVQRVVSVSRPSSTLVRAQSQLANLGYYRGTVDGSYGPLTSRAVAQFQADNGLRVTGRLDRATLKSLGV
jgi:hypothetical protein